MLYCQQTVTNNPLSLWVAIKYSQDRVQLNQNMVSLRIHKEKRYVYRFFYIIMLKAQVLPLSHHKRDVYQKIINNNK